MWRAAVSSARVPRLTAIIATAVAAASGLSAAYQRIGEARDRRKYPPPGRLVDVGGRRMHILAMGDGSPAVVIVPALGANVLEWVRVLRAASAETTGMLLIDSSHDGWDDFRRAVRRQLRVLGVRRLAAHLGLVGGLNPESLAWETVPEYAGAAKASSLSTKQRRTVVREMLLLARPQGQPQNLGALPVAVLSAGSAGRRGWAAWGAWCQLQDELAALSSRSEYTYALNGDHNVHLDDPDAVVQAIRDLVGRCR
jgi:pimeloyl-ACP methyl ester carboxylesterase